MNTYEREDPPCVAEQHAQNTTISSEFFLRGTGDHAHLIFSGPLQLSATHVMVVKAAGPGSEKTTTGSARLRKQFLKRSMAAPCSSFTSSTAT